MKQIIYLDRNNTPDVWADISRTIKKSYEEEKVKSFKSVLVIPEQHPNLNFNLYKEQNPICPEMIFECIKRVVFCSFFKQICKSF